MEGWAAIVIGLVAGALMYASVKFLEAKGIDDPVGAISVHGTPAYPDFVTTRR